MQAASPAALLCVDKPGGGTYFPTVLNYGVCAQSGPKIAQEDVMVEITQEATQQIAEYFKGRDVSPIRIFLNEGG